MPTSQGTTDHRSPTIHRSRTARSAPCPAPRQTTRLLAGSIAALTALALPACGDPVAPLQGDGAQDPPPVVVDTTRVPPADTARTPVARVQLDTGALVLDEGSARQLTAVALDSAGRTLDGRQVAWRTSDPLTAEVSAAGVVTALRSGVVTITASVEGRAAEARVTVASTFAFDLVFDMITGTSILHPALHRLDLRMPDAAPAPLSLYASRTSDVAVSPDGRMIAFVADGNGGPQLWVADRDSSNARRLTRPNATAFEDQPAWSPDGRRIAFHRWAYVGTPHDVWTVNVDGTDERNLTAALPGVQRAPTWSPRQPDGSYRVAFTHETRGAEYLKARIMTVRDDGLDPRGVTPDGDQFDDEPAWGPDGRSILFVRRSGEIFGDLWLVGPDGSGARALMIDDPPFEQRSPAWSPDGAHVAFTSSHEIIGNRSGDWQVYTVRADGTGMVRRTSTPSDKARPAWIAR